MFKVITYGTDFIKPKVGLIAASYHLLQVIMCSQHIQGCELSANMHQKHFKIH